MRYYSCTMNHNNHVTGIAMHICPWSGSSISSLNPNYFYLCKVQFINIHVTTMINPPCSTAASELFLMAHKDINNYTVCPVHHCNAPWLVTDSLFILRALLFHCTRCKMGSLVLTMRMWKMKIFGEMVVDLVGRKPQTIPNISTWRIVISPEVIRISIIWWWMHEWCIDDWCVDTSTVMSPLSPLSTEDLCVV